MSWQKITRRRNTFGTNERKLVYVYQVQASRIRPSVVPLVRMRIHFLLWPSQTSRKLPSCRFHFVSFDTSTWTGSGKDAVLPRCERLLLHNVRFILSQLRFVISLKAGLNEEWSWKVKPKLLLDNHYI